MAKKPTPPTVLPDADAALVKRFASLYEGYEKAFGTYEIKAKEASGKIKGRAITHKRGATLADYEKHLMGVEASDAIGVIPLLEDNSVAWSALDIDINSIDHRKLEAKIAGAKLPLLVCRSKSGGAHLYIFFKAPVPAEIVRERLADWSAELGYGGCEIFPKQSSRASPEDVGNWINLPYFGALSKMGTNRYAVINGEKAGLEAFIETAEKTKATFEKVKARALPRPTEGTALLYEAPPCLVYLHENGGFIEGTRNDGMFNVAQYLLRRYPPDWEKRLGDYNAEFCKPKLDPREIMEIIKSAKKKAYGYKCEEQPICSHCNKTECLKREYGIGQSRAGVMEIGGLIRYITGPGDPVRWGLEVSGKRIFVDNDTLYNKDSFNRFCMGELSMIPVQLTNAKWVSTLGEIIATAEVVELPPDAGPTGILWDHIEMFCLQKAQAKTMEEVWTGRPYNDGEKIYFRSVDLFTYLDQRHVDYGKKKQSVYHLLQSRNGHSEVRKIGGKTMNIWEMPTPKAPEAVTKTKGKTKIGTEEF